jgi:hypothetical protein
MRYMDKLLNLALKNNKVEVNSNQYDRRSQMSRF